MVTARTEAAHVGGVDLQVRRFGAGAPLVLLHGEDGLLFCAAFVDRLSEHFEVIVPSHPGWGGTARPADVTTIDDIAYLYLDFLASLPAPATVVGLSIGAWLGMEVATKSTANIARLVLAAPIGVKFGGREDRAFVDLYAVNTEQVIKALYADPAKAKDLSSLDDEGFMQLAMAEEAVARYGWEPYLHNPKLVNRLRRIDVPTLVVAGADDGFVLEDGYARHIAECIGEHARHQLIDGAGHRLEEEAPAELADAIRTFAPAERG
jgi:pimeloyl-ACP methyl ester carboxylesterase